ncbi:MAG: hypothetical protein HFJ53_02640 [Clostridia bacterium]|jgi:hypothetical protein|nr:hypothetical protein [Clostridia bacterium]
MENNNLKDKTTKRKFNIINNKTIIYWLIFLGILFISIIIIVNKTNIFYNNNETDEKACVIAELGEYYKKYNEENLKTDLKIEEIEERKLLNSYLDIKTIKSDDLPYKFNFINNIKLEEFKLTDSYKIYTKSNVNIDNYDILYGYVVLYKQDNEKNIKIGLSELELPIQNYLDTNVKTSKIGDVEIKILQYKKDYIAIFKLDDIYFSIETNNITQSQLVELLKSIITEQKNFND